MCVIKGTVDVIQVTMYLKMSMYSSNHVFKDEHGLQRHPNKLYYLEDMVVFPV